MTAPFEIPGLVLAGGLSRRMGSNKAMVQLGDAPLISHVISRITPQVSDVTINAAYGWAESFGLPLLPDTLNGHAGPLAGILAGMRHFQHRGDAASLREFACARCAASASHSSRYRLSSSHSRWWRPPRVRPDSERSRNREAPCRSTQRSKFFSMRCAPGRMW